MSALHKPRRIAAVLAIALAVSACSSDDDSTSSTAASESTTTAAVAEAAVPGPTSVTAMDQDSDGTTVVATTIDLGAPGFLTVHADADGAPGPIIGHNPELLPAGESTNVTVDLYEPLTEDATIWFMPHIDADGNGDYLFSPDEPVDGPAFTADGDVAVAPVNITIWDGLGEGALQLGTAETSLGTVLTDAAGLTLYGFLPDADVDGISACGGDCAAAWPPIFTPTADLPAGFDADIFSVVEAADGGYQLAAGGWPLYLWVQDVAEGDVTGQNVGDVWFVIGPDGNLIGAP